RQDPWPGPSWTPTSPVATGCRPTPTRRLRTRERMPPARPLSYRPTEGFRLLSNIADTAGHRSTPFVAGLVRTGEKERTASTERGAQDDRDAARHPGRGR